MGTEHQGLLAKSVRSIVAEDVDRLVEARAEETLVLEFKEQLNTATRGERKEFGKDVSAMANSAGGLIVYGIAEARDSDGVAVADRATPLPRDIDTQVLDDYLNTAVKPLPRYEMHRVDTEGGCFLLVRIQPSHDALHMLSVTGEHRYYRRTEKGARPMDAVSVERAFARIHRLRTERESRKREVLEEEDDVAVNAFRCLVIPLGTEADHVDIGTVRTEHLHHRFTEPGFLSNYTASDRGFESRTPPEASEAAAYLSRFRRDGALHLAWTFTAGDQWSPDIVLRTILQTFLLARHLWSEFNIVGPAIAVSIAPTSEETFYEGAFLTPRATTLPANPQRAAVEKQLPNGPDSGLEFSRLVLNRLYQEMGISMSPFFADDGTLSDRARKRLAAGILSQLET